MVLISILPAIYELNRALKVNNIFVTKIEKLVLSLSVSKRFLNTFFRQHQNVNRFIGTATNFSGRVELFNCTGTQNYVGT